MASNCISQGSKRPLLTSKDVMSMDLGGSPAMLWTEEATQEERGSHVQPYTSSDRLRD